MHPGADPQRPRHLQPGVARRADHGVPLTDVALRPVFDGHNDALTRDDHAGLGTGRDGGHIDIPRMREGGMRSGIFAVFTPSPGQRKRGLKGFGAPVDHETAAAHATAAAGRLATLERDGHMRLARSIEDLDAAASDPGSPPVAVLGLEGAEAIDPGLEALGHWYAAGLRCVGPVWSRPNDFAHGVPFAAPSSPDTGPGLSDRGRALVAACAELGILVDLSHLNEAGFWDVARLEAGPLVASHSGVHALAESSRNLTDDQLDAIGSSGGLVGIVYATIFLRGDFAAEADTPLSLIAEHARYVADRIGVEHVALGSDFDGALIPAPLGDVAGLPRLVAALGEAGFSDADLDAVCWGNWRRVLDAWWR